MAGPAAFSWSKRFRASLPGALVWRGLSYEPQFTGRARRAELLLVVIACLAACFALGVVAALDRTPFVVLNLLLLAALTGLPIIAAMVRRLHDSNRHGWGVLIGLAPYAGWLFLGFLLIVDGTEGDNAFGPNPRE